MICSKSIDLFLGTLHFIKSEMHFKVTFIVYKLTLLNLVFNKIRTKQFKNFGDKLPSS